MVNAPDNHAALRRLIEAHFNLEELRDLCATLGVDYDQLGEGLIKSSRVLALVDYLERRGRLSDLIHACRTLRPNVIWPYIPEPAETPCPYKGLYAFQEEDAHLFFGRDEAAQQVITAVTQQPLTVVIGRPVAANPPSSSPACYPNCSMMERGGSSSFGRATSHSTTWRPRS